MVDETQLSQRMPSDMVDDLEDFAEDHGLSRNGAINLLVGKGLRSEEYR